MLKRYLFGAILVLAALLISRLLYAPPYLYFFDNANFALAIDHFNPGMHQPQPPGYPLFVLLLRALNPIFHSANNDLIAAGLIGSAAGLTLVWFWSAFMFGNRAGWIATCLLLANPVFWVAGLASPVRTFLVVLAAVTAILSWQCMTQREGFQRWFYALSFALGFLSGFRPECLLILFTIWMVTGFYRRVSLRVWAIGTLVLTVSALIWIVPIVLILGGLSSTLTGFAKYFRDTSVGLTFALGAGGSTAAETIRRVLIWNFGLAVVWAWAIPFALTKLRTLWTRAHTISLGASLLPPLFFHSLIYVRDVDQTLVTIPVLCVVGGAVLAGIRPNWLMIPAAILAILLTGYSFRHPLFPEMATASRGAMRFMNDWNRSTFRSLEEIAPNKDCVLIWDDSVVSWRQASYYYPTIRLLSLQVNPPLWILSNVGTQPTMHEGAILVPGAKLLVIGASYRQATQLAQLPGARQKGPLVLVPWGADSEVKVGNYTLRSQ